MMISKPAAQMIRSLRILIIGMGAGGNEILKNLVLEGFGDKKYDGKITVVDIDEVEDSNLSKSVLFSKEDIGRSKAEVAAKRAAAMALAEEPDIRYINANILTDIGKGIFLEHNFVICAVDTLKGRAYISDMCVLTKTPFMEVGFTGYNADVCFFAPVGLMKQKDGTIIDRLPASDGKFPDMLGEFPVCLREEIGTGSFEEKRNSCSGFKVKDKDLAKIPTIQSGAALTGALIVQELVKFLDGKDTLRNKMLLFFGLPLQTMLIEYSRRPDCSIHDKKMNVVTVPVHSETTIEEILKAIEMSLGGTALLSLPDTFVLSGICHCCGKKVQIKSRSKEVWDEQRWCDECRERYPDYMTRLFYPSNLETVPKEVSLNSPLSILKRKILEMGVPENDILDCIVLSEDGPKFYNVYLKNG